MVIFGLALIGTLFIMVLLVIGRLVFGRREPFNLRRFVIWLVAYSIFNYVVSLLIIYFSLPGLTGPFGGWQWVLWPLFFSSIGNLFAFARPALGALSDAATASQGRSGTKRTTGMPTSFSRGAVAAGILGLIVVGVIGIVAPILITIFTTWFDVNAKALANIPNIHTQQTSVLPPTDPNNVILVSQSIASYKGQQIIGSNGQNLGSEFNLDPASYVLQSINHHLYYVAPFTYNNIFINLSNPTTPGFVVVDAENPQASPTLHIASTDSLAYLPGALLNQDLLRHVYLAGYTYGKLIDPTLELDDNFHPYWTISLMQPIRGYVGDSLSEVLIVDAHTGVITKYTPNKVPTWVDRIMPSDTINQYLSWWGQYHAAPWFNPSGAGQQTTASDPELLYNSKDQPVWLVPMTSSSSNDSSSTGVFLFSTHGNSAEFYPQAAGLGIGDNVTNTFKSTRANIRNYAVANVQLYQLYGQPTWVGIYTQSTSSGDIFEAVGLVYAKQLNGNNVQFESSLPTALQDYQQWLTQNPPGSNGGGGGGGSSGTPTTVTVQGKVLRISSVQQSTSTIYYLQIQGQSVIFTANLTLSAKLPLVQPGDTVVMNYTQPAGTVVNVTSFDDTSISLGTSTPVPGGTATPTLTPVLTPTVKH